MYDSLDEIIVEMQPTTPHAFRIGRFSRYLRLLHIFAEIQQLSSQSSRTTTQYVLYTEYCTRIALRWILLCCCGASCCSSNRIFSSTTLDVWLLAKPGFCRYRFHHEWRQNKSARGSERSISSFHFEAGRPGVHPTLNRYVCMCNVQQ